MKTSDPRLLAHREGIAALEFALLTPVMVIILAGLFDIGQAVITYRRVTDTAHQVALIATELAVQPDHSLNVTPQEALQSASAIYAFFPEFRTNLAKTKYTVTLSSIAYQVDKQGNSTAYTAWSVGMDYLHPDVLVAGSPSLPDQRPCGEQTQVAANAQTDLTSIPTAGVSALAPLMVADVSVTFQPAFGRFITGPITFHRMALLMPRTFQPGGDHGKKNGKVPPGQAKKGAGPGVDSQGYIYYDEFNPANPAVCSGYTLNS